MLLHILLLTSCIIISMCPRYTLTQNPSELYESEFLVKLDYIRQFFALEFWKENYTLSCTAGIVDIADQRLWFTNIPYTTDDTNNTGTFVLKSMYKDTIKIKSPYCELYNDNFPCFRGITYQFYMPEVSLLFNHSALFNNSLEACANEPFAIKIVSMDDEFIPFIASRMRSFSSKTILSETQIRQIYDTVVINNFPPNLKSLKFFAFSNNYDYIVNYVTNSPNCMGPKRRIMYPLNNSEYYYSNYGYYYTFLRMTAEELGNLCFPSAFSILRDSQGNKLTVVPTDFVGRRKFSCEIVDDPLSKIYFYVTVMKGPRITQKLFDCQNIENRCEFSVHYEEGDRPVQINWFFNGKEIQYNLYFNLSSDKRTLKIPLIDISQEGNIQVFVSNIFGNTMSAAYIRRTAIPFFVVDLPKFKSINQTDNFFKAKVEFNGREDPVMYWLMNGQMMEQGIPHLNASVNVKTRECILEFEYLNKENIMDNFVCVFRVGNYEIRSTKLTLVASSGIRSTVSLMIPVLGVLGGAVVLALVLIPICVVYRNRHSKAYRLAMVERQCGLNPDKDFKTLNDFGENSRRQARHPNYSILRSGVGSTEGGSSYLPNNNMPEIKEHASFLNDYSA